MIEFYYLHWEEHVGFFLMHSKSHYKRVTFSFWVSVVTFLSSNGPFCDYKYLPFMYN